MKECPGCNRTYDDSWRVCLICEIALKHLGENEHEAAEEDWEKFTGNKFLIVIFSLFLMLMAPVIVVIIYLAYFQAFDIEGEQHEKKQLKEVMVFDKEEDKEEEYPR